MGPPPHERNPYSRRHPTVPAANDGCGVPAQSWGILCPMVSGLRSGPSLPCKGSPGKADRDLFSLLLVSGQLECGRKPVQRSRGSWLVGGRR